MTFYFVTYCSVGAVICRNTLLSAGALLHRSFTIQHLWLFQRYCHPRTRRSVGLQNPGKVHRHAVVRAPGRRSLLHNDMHDHKNPRPASLVVPFFLPYFSALWEEFNSGSGTPYATDVCSRGGVGGIAGAVEFLANKAASEAEKRLHNMPDVLRERGVS